MTPFSDFTGIVFAEPEPTPQSHEFKDPGADRWADGSQTPNDAAAIPCAKAGSNTTQLEHEARYGREVAQRLDELMRRHREGHAVTYRDLQAVRGDV